MSWWMESNLKPCDWNAQNHQATRPLPVPGDEPERPSRRTRSACNAFSEMAFPGFLSRLVPSGRNAVHRFTAVRMNRALSQTVDHVMKWYQLSLRGIFGFVTCGCVACAIFVRFGAAGIAIP